MVFLRISWLLYFSFLQEAVFDKNKGTVCLKTFNLYKKILTFSKGGYEQGEKAVCGSKCDEQTEEMYTCLFSKLLWSSVLKLVTSVSRSALFVSSRCCHKPLGTLKCFFRLGCWMHPVILIQGFHIAFHNSLSHSFGMLTCRFAFPLASLLCWWDWWKNLKFGSRSWDFCYLIWFW